jgi:predicted dehydrogenase
MMNDRQKIRYAVVGLGWFAQDAALPAFTAAENSELVALVSGDRRKLVELGKMYQLEHTYLYEEYDELLASGNIDAVYIALPNHLHCEYTVRAARAGIHVLCEKPMAVTAAECREMMAAAAEHHVKLAIAYRLHLEPANLAAVEVLNSGQIGEPRIFNSLFTQQTIANNIRLQQEAGGGTLEDIGIYCINAARYLFQAEPTQVFATAASKADPRFAEVAEMTSVVMHFPEDRLATFTCSFGTAPVSQYQVLGTNGNLLVEPAYTSQGEISHTVTVNGEKQHHNYGSHGQLAALFGYFAHCILHDLEPEPSGAEGLIDIQIIQALHESIETGRSIALDGCGGRDRRPTISQQIERPPIPQQPEMIHAKAPFDRP